MSKCLPGAALLVACVSTASAQDNRWSGGMLNGIGLVEEERHVVRQTERGRLVRHVVALFAPPEKRSADKEKKEQERSLHTRGFYSIGFGREGGAVSIICGDPNEVRSSRCAT